jgi:hypothetical protein
MVAQTVKELQKLKPCKITVISTQACFMVAVNLMGQCGKEIVLCIASWFVTHAISKILHGLSCVDCLFLAPWWLYSVWVALK